MSRNQRLMAVVAGAVVLAVAAVMFWGASPLEAMYLGGAGLVPVVFGVAPTTYDAEAFHGYGAQLMVGDGASPEEFHAIAEVHAITPGAMTTAAIARTHLLSPQAHTEKIPGIRDTAAFGITGGWRPNDPTQSNDDGSGSPAGSGGLVFLARTRAQRNFKIVLPDDASTEWPFHGFVSSFQPGAINNDGVVTFSAEITPTRDVAEFLP